MVKNKCELSGILRSPYGPENGPHMERVGSTPFTVYLSDSLLKSHTYLFRMCHSDQIVRLEVLRDLKGDVV